MSEPSDDLLDRVHKRLGLGVDIQTFADGTVEIVWRRDYRGAWSDLRSINADGFAAGLKAVLEYEDEADRLDAAEEKLEEAER